MSSETTSDSDNELGSTSDSVDEVQTGDELAGSHGLYIKQVAQILGVSAWVLRTWESERLIVPSRSPSGYRVYSASDVDRLRRIRDLIQQDGLNAAGVRRLLSDSKSTPAEVPTAAMHARIQKLRKEQHKTLRDLATATGLSASAISAIERGVSMPSTRTLSAIAEALDTTVPKILGTASKTTPVIVREGDRTSVDLGIPGVVAASLAAAPGALDPLIVTVEPGAGPDRQSATGDGETFIFVLDGEVELVIDELEHHRLSRGYSALFRNAHTHRWINRTLEPATLLIVRLDRVL